MRKKILSSITILAMVISLIGILPAEAASIVSFDFNAPYQQSSARTMTDMINDFRTGSDAWYWNEMNTDKVTVSGLSGLTFDYELEEVAMQRAAELVFKYAHVRPDGSDCFTAYTLSFSNSTKGENIAIGTTDMTAAYAFDLWKEESEDYSGQGHRRNMLNSNFQYVGIAHVYYKGCHYWVQEFSSTSGSTAKTTAVDTEKKVTIDVDSSTITKSSITLDSTSASIGVNDEITLPTANCLLRLEETWSYAPDIETIITPTWSVTSGSSCVTLSDSTVTGNICGTAELTASYNGISEKYTVTVDHNFDSGTISKAATCTTDGEKTYTCTLCGKKYTEAIPATGHNYQNGICTICNEKDPNYEQLLQNPSNQPNNNANNNSSNNSSKSNQTVSLIDKGKTTSSTNRVTTPKPAKVKSVKLTGNKKKLSVSWKKIKIAKGYQVQVATNKKFKKKKIVFDKFTNKRKLIIKSGKIKRKKTYYVRVRAYAEINGKKVDGKWSKKVKVKIK